MAKRTRSAKSGSRIGLALAGGGPQGAIWEIGALRALEEAVEGVDLNQMHVYVGVSAGAFLGANLANDLTTGQMSRAIVKREPGEHPFSSEQFFKPRYSELAKRVALLPKLLAQALAKVGGQGGAHWPSYGATGRGDGGADLWGIALGCHQAEASAGCGA